MRRPPTLPLVSLAAGLLGCTEPEGRILHVMAASSLTEVMGALAAGLERAEPDLEVELQLAGSQTLRLQIEHGARADLVTSAALEHLDRIAAAELAEPPRPFT